MPAIPGAKAKLPSQRISMCCDFKKRAHRTERRGIQMMTGLEIFRRIKAQPDFSVVRSPYQRLERQVEGKGRILDHQRSAGLGITEHDQLSFRHGKSNAFGFCGLINTRKDFNAFGFQRGFQPVSRLGNGKPARQFDLAFSTHALSLNPQPSASKGKSETK